MELINKRFLDDHTTTVGMLFIDGKKTGYVIEDTFRHDKISKITRIPAGRYEIILRKAGGLYPKYKKRYNTDGMLWLLDVPEFEWIYMHPGKDSEWTDGCLLVTSEISLSKTIYGVVDADFYRYLHILISSAITNNDHVYITILDN